MLLLLLLIVMLSNLCLEIFAPNMTSSVEVCRLRLYNGLWPNAGAFPGDQVVQHFLIVCDGVGRSFGCLCMYMQVHTHLKLFEER